MQINDIPPNSIHTHTHKHTRILTRATRRENNFVSLSCTRLCCFCPVFARKRFSIKYCFVRVLIAVSHCEFYCIYFWSVFIFYIGLRRLRLASLRSTNCEFLFAYYYCMLFILFYYYYCYIPIRFLIVDPKGP